MLLPAITGSLPLGPLQSPMTTQHLDQSGRQGHSPLGPVRLHCPEPESSAGRAAGEGRFVKPILTAHDASPAASPASSAARKSSN